MPLANSSIECVEIVDISSEPITIRVRDQNGEETYFKINKEAKMQLIFDAYAQRKGATGSIRFLLNNKEIEPNQTAMELHLNDHDQIDCIVEHPVQDLTTVTIRISDSYGYRDETFFKLKTDTKMELVFETYARRKGIKAPFMRFLLNDIEIEPHQTPEMLGLEDLDDIPCITVRHLPDLTPTTIRVRAQNGEETFFKIKRCTRMQKVFDTYAARKGMLESSFRFLLDGQKILPYQTPQTLELDDQEVIDVIIEQSGS